MRAIVRELFSIDDKTLFREAQALSKARSRILCSPNPIIGTCTTQPTCRHCRWENTRRVDPDFQRKRTPEDIIARTRILVEAGVQRIFMPSGWYGYDVPEYFCDFVRTVKEHSGCEVYGLFGAVNKASLARLQQAGMDGYLCGIESPNEQVYRHFRPGGDSLKDRIDGLVAAKELGLKLWSGFLVGLGESQADIHQGLAFLKDLEVDSLSILPFTPFPYTEMWAEDPVNPLRWARVLAVARLYMDDVDIFTTLEGCYGDYGRVAGANGFYVFPPGKL